MESKHLSYFKVENFKRFDSLEVTDIGQFNLIVGDNNVGKTSLLEAFTFDDENFNELLANLNFILFARHISKISNEFTILDFFTRNNETPLNYYFRYTGDRPANKLEVTQRLRSTLTNDEIDTIGPKLKLYNDNKIVEFILDNKKYFNFFSEIATTYNDCPIVPFTRIYGDDIKDYFSKFARSTKWLENFKVALREFIPKLTSIEVSNAYTTNSIIIIREEDKDISQPLSQYGDGMIKLFRYLLELDNCQNKRLMIDEIDTGIHYSRTKGFIKSVLQSAKNNNVQIFATTHSKECIQYYKEALNELGYEGDGRVIRLADTNSGIKAYTLNYDQIENSFFAEREIR